MRDVDKHLSSFQFIDYAFTSMNFKIHSDWKPTVEEVPLRIKLGVTIALPEGDGLINSGGVELSCSINEDELSKSDTLFEMHLVMRGQFATNDKLTRNQMQQFLKINGVTAMFPFLRAAVTNLSNINNIPTVILPLVNVYSLMTNEESSE